MLLCFLAACGGGGGNKTTDLRYKNTKAGLSQDASQYVLSQSFLGQTQDWHIDEVHVWLQPQSGSVTLYVQNGPLPTSTQLASHQITVTGNNGKWYTFKPRDSNSNLVLIPKGTSLFIRVSAPQRCWWGMSKDNRINWSGANRYSFTGQFLGYGSNSRDHAIKIYSQESF